MTVHSPEDRKQPMTPAPTTTSRDALYEEFDALVADTIKLLKTAPAANGEILDAGRTAVEEGLANAEARMVRLRDQSVRQVQSVARAGDRYVHENPWRTAGIVATVSALAGLAAGILITRR
jgi:ElaB/YqjD/DUF883 family membrane-anchored ribosome-binding protein